MVNVIDALRIASRGKRLKSSSIQVEIKMEEVSYNVLKKGESIAKKKFMHRIHAVNHPYNVGWILNVDAPQCMNCDEEFRFWGHWRHHCRCCGHIFCENCCNESLSSHTQLLGDTLRVCDTCKQRENPS